MFKINRFVYHGHQSPAPTSIALRCDRGVIHILDLNENGCYPLAEMLNFQFYKKLLKMLPPDYQPKKSRVFCYSHDGFVFEWFGYSAHLRPLSSSDLPYLCNDFISKTKPAMQIKNYNFRA